MSKHLITENKLQALEIRADAYAGNFEPAVFGICDMDRKVLRRCHYGGNVTLSEPDIFIPERLEKLLYPKRLKIIYGGRGSAKTRTIAAVLTELIRFNDKRTVCLREFLESIQISCYQEFVDEVDRRGINGTQIRVTNKEISSHISDGRINFKGMHNNVTTIKGLANYDIAWGEEVENMSLISWDTLEPTMRAAGSEIWMSFNPRFETDPSWTELVLPYHDKMVDGFYEDDDVLIIEINHIHNPWLTEELRKSMEKMKKRDFDRYLWIWEGRFNKKSDEQIMSGKWESQEFEVQDHWEGPFFGADFGFSQDPSTIIKMWIDPDTERLYIEYEAWGIGVELDDMAKFYAGREGANDEERENWGPLMEETWPGLPGAKENYIYGDCSRPETINHISNRGFIIDAAEKWKGSVEDGITYLRSFDKIVIHPRCIETLKEAEMYKYKVDPLTEKVLPLIVDAHNHCWDAIRYGLWEKIKNQRSFFDV